MEKDAEEVDQDGTDVENEGIEETVQVADDEEYDAGYGVSPLAIEYDDNISYNDPSVKDQKTGKKGGKKGKKAPPPPLIDDEDMEDYGEDFYGGEEPPAKKSKKGGKGKGKKAKPIIEDEGEMAITEEAKPKERAAEEGGESKDKTKKEKGKKGKKGKKEEEIEEQIIEPEMAASRLEIQMSISAFIKQYASMQELADDEEWTWESYTDSTISVKEPPPTDKGKKGKKGKGGKKGKKGKDKEETQEVKEPVEREESEEDLMAEIKKMKEAADAAAAADAAVDAATLGGVEFAEEVVKPKKPKGKKGPKLSKAQRAKLEEEMRIQAELDAIIAAEEERIRLIEERKNAIEKEKREISELFFRKEQLHLTISIINSLKNKKIKKDIEDKDQRQWEQYLKCDGLPDPYVCGTLSTYLFLWGRVLESTTIEDAAQRTLGILEMLDLFTTLIDDPVGVGEIQIANWKWVHRLFRVNQQNSLDIACYKLLKDIENNFHRINFHQLDYQRKEPDFIIRMWLLQRLPKSLPKRRRKPPVKTIMDVPDMLMTIRIPPSVDLICMVLRALYVKYDHLSDLCANYDTPPTPEQFKMDLFTVTQKEWYSKLYYKYDNRDRENDPPKKDMPFVDKEQGIVPTVPYQKLEPTASEFVIAEEDIVYLQIRENLITKVEEHVLNLRKYVIIGGVYALERFHQPPQPRVFVTMDMTLSRLQSPQRLTEAPFYIAYKPPEPLEDAIYKLPPEEIDEIITTRQKEAYDRLMHFAITLPSYVMYFEKPMVYQWDQHRLLWTDADIYDLKHSEEGINELSFKTGKEGSFGLAVYKYTNLPYQTWELRPEKDGSVIFQITGVTLDLQFVVKDGLICVRSYLGAPNDVLDNMIGIYYRIPKIKQILKEVGVDFFPDIDSFCYIEGACEKHWPVEHHTYYNMAQMSVKYNFSWSRWNMTAGRRNLVLRMRVYRPDREIQIPFSTLYVTPIQTWNIQCNEESEEFSTEIVSGMTFYADLYNLMRGTAPMMVKSTLQNVPHEQISAVAELLIATRILSLA